MKTAVKWVILVFFVRIIRFVCDYLVRIDYVCGVKKPFRVIPKEIFVSVMESLREQMEFDLLQSQKLEEVFGCEVCIYDNSRLQRAVLDILRVWFPKDGDHCELDHFVYELDFGKRWENEDGEMVLIGREDLGDFWERLQVESGKFEKRPLRGDVDETGFWQNGINVTDNARRAYIDETGRSKKINQPSKE